MRAREGWFYCAKSWRPDHCRLFFRIRVCSDRSRNLIEVVTGPGFDRDSREIGLAFGGAVTAFRSRSVQCERDRRRAVRIKSYELVRSVRSRCWRNFRQSDYHAVERSFSSRTDAGGNGPEVGRTGGNSRSAVCPSASSPVFRWRVWRSRRLRCIGSDTARGSRRTICLRVLDWFLLFRLLWHDFDRDLSVIDRRDGFPIFGYDFLRWYGNPTASSGRYRAGDFMSARHLYRQRIDLSKIRFRIGEFFSRFPGDVRIESGSDGAIVFSVYCARVQFPFGKRPLQFHDVRSSRSENERAFETDGCLDHFRPHGSASVRIETEKRIDGPRYFAFYPLDDPFRRGILRTEFLVRDDSRAKSHHEQEKRSGNEFAGWRRREMPPKADKHLSCVAGPDFQKRKIEQDEREDDNG